MNELSNMYGNMTRNFTLNVTQLMYVYLVENEYKNEVEQKYSKYFLKKF